MGKQLECMGWCKGNLKEFLLLSRHMCVLSTQFALKPVQGLVADFSTHPNLSTNDHPLKPVLNKTHTKVGYTSARNHQSNEFLASGPIGPRHPTRLAQEKNTSLVSPIQSPWNHRLAEVTTTMVKWDLHLNSPSMSIIFNHIPHHSTMQFIQFMTCGSISESLPASIFFIHFSPMAHGPYWPPPLLPPHRSYLARLHWGSTIRPHLPGETVKRRQFPESFLRLTISYKLCWCLNYQHRLNQQIYIIIGFKLF